MGSRASRKKVQNQPRTLPGVNEQGKGQMMVETGQQNPEASLEGSHWPNGGGLEHPNSKS